MLPVFFYCCETWELTAAHEARLRGEQRRIIRIMCGVGLVDRVSNDVLRDRVGVVVKIEDMIIQSRLRGTVMSCVETSIPKDMKLWKLK